MKRTPAALAREAAELFVGETRASDAEAKKLHDDITSEGEYRALKALFLGDKRSLSDLRAPVPAATVYGTSTRLQ